MTYTNAQYTNPENTSIRCDINGVTSYVPVAPGNSDYARIQELVATGELIIASYEPPAPPPVTQITMRQARLELYRRNLLDQVQTLIEASGGEAQIEWDYATLVYRDSPLVTALSEGLNLTISQVDQMFEDAAKL
jgi:hypothetical protein